MNNNESEPQSSNSNKVDVSLIPNIVGPLMPLLTQVYTDLASPGVKKVGMALETVLDLGYTFLAMPLQNASNKRKLVINRNFELYKKKMEKVNEEDVVEVSPELGVPLLQKLTYIRNEELAELFINLLTSASSINSNDSAHPGFLRIIENISVDEARILNYLAKQKDNNIPFISFIGHSDINNSFSYITTRLTDIRAKVDLLTPHKDHIYIDNLISMGLIEMVGTSTLRDNRSYEELEELYREKRIEIEQEVINNQDNTFSSLKLEKGLYRVTSFAGEFFRICIEDTVHRNVNSRF
jgi:hypothetical protein